METFIPVEEEREDVFQPVGAEGEIPTAPGTIDVPVTKEQEKRAKDLIDHFKKQGLSDDQALLSMQKALVADKYLTKGKPELSVVDKVMDYLGIRKPPPKTTPLHLEAMEKGKMPYDIREDVFGTGRVEELRKVFQRGLAGASFGMTDLISKALKGEVETPETIAGTISGAGAELLGFIYGPFKAASLITGFKLAPTGTGLLNTARMMAKGGATLGIASGLSSIIPELMENESLTDAGKKVAEHTGTGALVGAVFPTFAYVPNKALRLAVGLAVMDKIRAGTNEWFTLDDVITGIYNGDIDKRELAMKSYDYLLDLYFISHVPSMKKQAESFKHNEAIREILKVNPEEVETAILDLEKDGFIPGSEKRETSKIDEQPIDIVKEKEERQRAILQEIVKKDMEVAEKLPPEEFPIMKEEIPEKPIAAPSPEKGLPVPEGWNVEVNPNFRRTAGWKAEVDWKNKKIIFETELDSKNPDIVNHEIGHIKLEEKLGDVGKDSPIIQEYVTLRKEPEDMHINFIREHMAMDYGLYMTHPGLMDYNLRNFFDKHFIGLTPELSPTEKGQFKLPGVKIGIEGKPPTEKPPTLEGTPLMEAAIKAEREKVQPGLFGKLEVKPWSGGDIVDAINFLTGGKGISPTSIEMESLKPKEIGMFGKANVVKKGGVGFDTLVEELNHLGFSGDSGELADQLLSTMEGRKEGARIGKKLIHETPEQMADRVWEQMMKGTGPETSASVGRYRNTLPTTMDLPEIVKLAKDLMGGKYPEIREKLRAFKGAALGVFWGKEGGKIGLKAEVFKDIDQARWTLSHEIGHLIDYLPDAELKRGNILGRIATLKNYLKQMIEEAPPSLEHWLLTEKGQAEWKKIRAKIRKQARVEAKEEGISPKEDKEMFNDFVKGRYAELKAEWIGESGFISREEITGELKNLTQAIKPFEEAKDSDFTKYRYSSKELYADALSVLVNNPYVLKDSAPLFYDSFFSYLERKPEVKAEYEALQDSIKSGENFAERVKELRESFRKGDEKYYDSIRKEPKLSDSLKAELIDKHHFILKRINRFGESNLNPGENPRYKLQALDYRVAQTEAYTKMMYDHVIKPLENAGFSWEDFREWAFHQRVINERGEIANPMGWHPERSKRRIAEMPLQVKAFREVHDAFWKFRQEYFILPAKLMNMFSEETMKKIEDTEYYATFDLQEHFNDAYGRTTGPKIYHQYGTFQEIGDPIAATMMKDISLMMAMTRIKAARSVIDMFKKGFPDEIKDADTVWTGKGRIAVEPKEKGQYLIFDMQEGKARGYYVPEEIAKSFESNPLEAAMISRVLAKTGRPFKIAFTEANYGFYLFNIIRDYFRAARDLPKANVLNFVKYWREGQARAFKDTFSIPDDVVEQMLKGNMLISVTDTKGMRPEDMQIERLLKKTHIIEDAWRVEILKPFGHAFNYLTNIGRAFERGTKVGGYLYLKDKFPDMPEEYLAHLVRTQAGSPSFLTKGLAYPIYNNLLFYSNAMKEGYRGDYEAASKSPAEFMWKMAKYNIIPKILMKAAAIGLFGSLLGAEVKEIYDKATEYDKTNYHIIPLGITPSGKAVYFRIPQDETGRLIGGVMWKILGKEFNPMKGGLIDYMAGQAPTIHPLFDITTDIVQYYSGNNPYDSFRGRQAIPELTWKAHDIRTTEAFGKYLANKTGVGLVYRFKSDNDVEIRSTIEKIINFPILSNILGRFIKVTDYGEKEHIKQDITEPIQRERAREILDVHEAVQRLVTGEPLTEKDKLAIMREEKAGNQVVSRNIMVALGRRYGTAYTEALISAATKEERMAILADLMKKQGGQK